MVHVQICLEQYKDRALEWRIFYKNFGSSQWSDELLNHKRRSPMINLVKIHNMVKPPRELKASLFVDGSNSSFASEKEAIFHPTFTFFHGHFELKVESTVWPEPIWKKIKTSRILLPQHQSTYPRGPESASIEIPTFRPHFINFSKTIFY